MNQWDEFPKTTGHKLIINNSSGANATHSVVYQNEEGKWVTDLAYYSSFEKEMDMPEEVAMQFQCEEFLGGGK